MKIAIEGHEKAGKSSVCESIEALTRYSVTRQPDNRHLRRFIREIFEKETDWQRLPHELLTLAFAADRMYQDLEYQDEDIWITDRSVFSSLIIQGNTDLEFVAHINSQVMLPDVVFWLRVSEDTLKERMKEGGNLLDESALDMKDLYDNLLEVYAEATDVDLYVIECDSKDPEEIALEIVELIQGLEDDGLIKRLKDKIRGILC